MLLPDDPDQFETAFRAAVAAVLPSASVERVARTLVLIKLRADLDADRFIDVFFNSHNGRVDLALIDKGERVFGYDNLGGGIATLPMHRTDMSIAKRPAWMTSFGKC